MFCRLNYTRVLAGALLWRAAAGNPAADAAAQADDALLNRRSRHVVELSQAGDRFTHAPIAGERIELYRGHVRRMFA